MIWTPPFQASVSISYTETIGGIKVPKKKRRLS